MRSLDIPVFDWEQGYAIEEQIFQDVSLECANKLLAIAIEEKSFEHVISKLNTAFTKKILPYGVKNEVIYIKEDISSEDRVKIGTVAKNKKSEWYKNTSKGELIGDIIFDEFDGMQECRLKSQFLALQNWVTDNES